MSSSLRITFWMAGLVREEQIFFSFLVVNLGDQAERFAVGVCRDVGSTQGGLG